MTETSIRTTWHLDELLPPGSQLDFSRPHLPTTLTAEHQAPLRSAEERRMLNHIRSHSYMNLFAFVEEYIIAQTITHAHAEMFGDHEAIRALLRFGEEEVKHQKLFQRYCAFFERDFPTECEVLANASEVAGIILSHSPLAVMLVTLHLEVMTQQHYTDCVRGDESLDPVFSTILKNHWLEEAQHAKIDVLEIARMLEEFPRSAVEVAVAEYFGILKAFDGLLQQQVDMDVESLQRAMGRTLDAVERDEVHATQLRSNRRDFVVMGMTNPLFRQTIEQVQPGTSARVEQAAQEYGR